MRFTHHETVTAHYALEDGQSGWFNVIEIGGSCKIYENSLCRGEYNTLGEAIAAAQQLADQYDHRLLADSIARIEDLREQLSKLRWENLNEDQVSVHLERAEESLHAAVEILLLKRK
jgi:hypothetical protein